MRRRSCAGFIVTCIAAASLGIGLLCSCTSSSNLTQTEELVASVADAAGIDQSEVAAVVDGRIITQTEVDERVERFRAQKELTDQASYEAYLQSTGYSDWDVRAFALHDLIDKKLIAIEADRIGIEVGDEAVQARIRTLSAHYPSLESWVNALLNGGYNQASYEADVRASLLAYEVREAVIPTMEPTEDQISQYTAVVAPTLVGKRSSHILFSSSDYNTALDVYAQIKQGADFVDMVHAYSIDGSAAVDGDMGWDSINTYTATYQDALDHLNIGEVSDVVRSGFGYHIIKCTDRYDAPLNADGSVDVTAIPDDLLEYVKRSIVRSLKQQMFESYLDNLEASTALAAFDANGVQVTSEQIGLKTEAVELDFSHTPEGVVDEALLDDEPATGDGLGAIRFTGSDVLFAYDDEVDGAQP